jgi:hypothetical protein
MEFIKQPDKTPAVVSYDIAMLLRYADSVDKFLDSIGNTTFAAAFVFGAIRYLLDVAVKNINLLIQIKGKFEDINSRLRRLDVYLTLKEPTEAVKSMCIRALVNILRFCGLATKYLRSMFPGINRNALIVESYFRSSIRLKSEIEAVIVDLDRDTTVEVASGVAQLNSMMGQVQGDLRSLGFCKPSVNIAPLMLKIMEFHQFQEINRRDQQTSKWFPHRRRAISWCRIRETRISSDVTNSLTNCALYCVTQNQSNITTVSHCTG